MNRNRFKKGAAHWRPKGRFNCSDIRFVAVCAFLLLFALFSIAFGLHPLLCLELASSIVVCFLHVEDKRAALEGRWRIPEKLLLMLTLASGGIAPWCVRQLIRHKTANEHGYFAICEFFSLALHAGLWSWCW